MEIDLEEEENRCERYDMKLRDPPTCSRRRIFCGNLVIDDSWHAIATTAMESYGIFEHISFVEK